MSQIFLVGFVIAVALLGMLAGVIAIHRRQSRLEAKRKASQLIRRADHMFRVALAAQVHTRSDAIARTLLKDAIQVLDYSLQLAPQTESGLALLQECHELIAAIDNGPESVADKMDDPFVDFPEDELIEAQLHLTEAMRLLIGLEKRARISADELSEMSRALKHAQRAIDLRLQLHQATHALAGERNTPKFDDARIGEYLAAAIDRNRTQSSPH